MPRLACLLDVAHAEEEGLRRPETPHPWPNRGARQEEDTCGYEECWDSPWPRPPSCGISAFGAVGAQAAGAPNITREECTAAGGQITARPYAGESCTLPDGSAQPIT